MAPPTSQKSAICEEDKFLKRFSLRKYTVPADRLPSQTIQLGEYQRLLNGVNFKSVLFMTGVTQSSAVASNQQRRYRIEYSELKRSLKIDVPWWLRGKVLENCIRSEQLVSLVEEKAVSNGASDNCATNLEGNKLSVEAIDAAHEKSTDITNDKDLSDDGVEDKESQDEGLHEISCVERRLSRVLKILNNLEGIRLDSGCDACQCEHPNVTNGAMAILSNFHQVKSVENLARNSQTTRKSLCVCNLQSVDEEVVKLCDQIANMIANQTSGNDPCNYKSILQQVKMIQKSLAEIIKRTMCLENSSEMLENVNDIVAMKVKAIPDEKPSSDVKKNKVKKKKKKRYEMKSVEKKGAKPKSKESAPSERLVPEKSCDCVKKKHSKFFECCKCCKSKARTTDSFCTLLPKEVAAENDFEALFEALEVTGKKLYLQDIPMSTDGRTSASKTREDEESVRFQNILQSSPESGDYIESSESELGDRKSGEFPISKVEETSTDMESFTSVGKNEPCKCKCDRKKEATSSNQSRPIILICSTSDSEYDSCNDRPHAGKNCVNATNDKKNYVRERIAYKNNDSNPNYCCCKQILCEKVLKTESKDNPKSVKSNESIKGKEIRKSTSVTIQATPKGSNESIKCGKNIKEEIIKQQYNVNIRKESIQSNKQSNYSPKDVNVKSKEVAKRQDNEKNLNYEFKIPPNIRVRYSTELGHNAQKQQKQFLNKMTENGKEIIFKNQVPIDTGSQRNSKNLKEGQPVPMQVRHRIHIEKITPSKRKSKTESQCCCSCSCAANEKANIPVRKSIKNVKSQKNEIKKSESRSSLKRKSEENLKVDSKILCTIKSQESGCGRNSSSKSSVVRSISCTTLFPPKGNRKTVRTIESKECCFDYKAGSKPSFKSSMTCTTLFAPNGNKNIVSNTSLPLSSHSRRSSSHSSVSSEQCNGCTPAVEEQHIRQETSPKNIPKQQKKEERLDISDCQENNWCECCKRPSSVSVRAGSLESDKDLICCTPCSNFCNQCIGMDIPIVRRNLAGEIRKIIGNRRRNSVFLKFTIVGGNLFHLQICTDNDYLGCLYATQSATFVAREANGFDGLVTLSVTETSNTLSQIETLVDHAFMVVQQERRCSF